MIDIYFWPTPNGFKINIFCEEAGVPYKLVPVNIGAGDQFKPEFLAISPNNRMPAIVDPEGPDGKPISVFESGAILQYLGRKFGKFYPTDERKRVIEQFVLLEVAEIFHQVGTEVLEYLTGNGLERIGETDVSLAITRDPFLHFGDEDELSDQHRQHQDQYQHHKQRHSPLTRAKVLSRDDRQLVHRRLRIPSKPGSGNHSSLSDQFIGRSHASLH